MSSSILRRSSGSFSDGIGVVCHQYTSNGTRETSKSMIRAPYHLGEFNEVVKFLTRWTTLPTSDLFSYKEEICV